MDNSYVVDDGLAVSAYTDTVNQSDAKAEVCKAVLVEMLLRVPRRRCVCLLLEPLLRIPDGVQVIWGLVRQLQRLRSLHRVVQSLQNPRCRLQGRSAKRLHPPRTPRALFV